MRYIACLALAVGLLSVVGILGCRQRTESPHAAQAAAPQQAGKHVAYHDGCLNAIVTCENGHAEVKVSGDTLQCWFVGGGNDTESRRRSAINRLRFRSAPAGGHTKRTLVLQAKPLAAC